jgi:hypothetical protein
MLSHQIHSTQVESILKLQISKAWLSNKELLKELLNVVLLTKWLWVIQAQKFLQHSLIQKIDILLVVMEMVVFAYTI